MLASTVTASPRKAMASTGLGAAAVIGYVSSRLARSSALIAEISATTASTSVPVCTQRCTTSISAGGTHRSRPPAAQPCPNAVSPPPAPRPAAAPRRRAGPPSDAAAPATTAWTDSIDRSCVYSSHKMMPASAMSITNSQCACHRGERGQTRHRQSMLRRWLTTIGPRLRHRDLATETAGTHEYRVPGPALDVENLQSLPDQRVERMHDDNETQIITGQRGTMPPPSEYPADAAYATPV